MKQTIKIILPFVISCMCVCVVWYYTIDFIFTITIYKLEYIYTSIALSIVGFLIYFRKVFKFKVMLAYILGILSLFLIFVRTVPNYAHEDGFSFVSPYSYYKYQQGYCLSEDRILSKEERYKRGIVDYMNKVRDIQLRLARYSCMVYEPCSTDMEKYVIGYYESDELSHENWFELIKKEQERIIEEKNNTYHEFSDDIMHGNIKFKKKTITTQDVIIKGNKAGFKKPILYINVIIFGNLYNDRNFVLGKDFTFERVGIYPLHSQLNKSKKENFERWFNEDIYTEYKKRRQKTDNCGNTWKPVNYIYEKSKKGHVEDLKNAGAGTGFHYY